MNYWLTNTGVRQWFTDPQELFPTKARIQQNVIQRNRENAMKRKASFQLSGVNKRRRQYAPSGRTYGPKGSSSVGAVLRSYQKPPNARTGGFIGRELKNIDAELAAQDLSATWAGGELDPATALCLNAIDRGTSEEQRIGNRVRMTGITIKGILYVGAAESSGAPTSDSLIRLALVLDQQTNAAQLNAEDVFEAAASVDLTSHRELEYTQRFQVLKDKIFRIPTSQATMNEGSINLFASAQVMIPFKLNVNFKTPIVTTYNGTATPPTIAQITDNSLHLIGVYTGAVTVIPKITYHSRIRYVG